MTLTLFTTAMLFALTPLTAASLSTTDTSNWNGYYRNDPLTAGTSVSGTTSVCFNGCWGTHSTNIGIVSRASAQYGSLGISVDANSGSSDAMGNFRPSDGYFPRYELNQVKAFGTADFIDALTLFTGGIGTGNITFHIDFPGYIPIGNDPFSATGRFTAGGITAMRQGYVGVLFQTITIPFTDGISIPISGFLSAGAYDYAPNDISRGSAGGNPAVIVRSIQVFDPGGTQLNSYRYGAESNASYPFVGGTAVEIPEPGSFTLMGIGAMMVCRWRVVKKSINMKRLLLTTAMLLALAPLASWA
jgi:hypothetical protein